VKTASDKSNRWRLFFKIFLSEMVKLNQKNLPYSYRNVHYNGGVRQEKLF